MFGLHHINEITTATQLLAVGLNQVVVVPDWYASESATAFTCMASGVEPILKLTYGLDTLHRGRPFPKDETLRKLGPMSAHAGTALSPADNRYLDEQLRMGVRTL